MQVLANGIVLPPDYVTLKQKIANRFPFMASNDWKSWCLVYSPLVLDVFYWCSTTTWCTPAEISTPSESPTSSEPPASAGPPASEAGRKRPVEEDLKLMALTMVNIVKSMKTKSKENIMIDDSARKCFSDKDKEKQIVDRLLKKRKFFRCCLIIHSYYIVLKRITIHLVLSNIARTEPNVVRLIAGGLNIGALPKDK
ncbi:hypothetical protein INT45_011083 [Circinella minor]|uniref:Uncharacterized protein n=1 Tax=Circinella minor TaxID=1195481 RepID=A0A8H7VMN1_9FUNG|nr:hypothetical protein INT45_011083 [Circinella minor]